MPAADEEHTQQHSSDRFDLCESRDMFCAGPGTQWLACSSAPVQQLLVEVAVIGIVNGALNCEPELNIVNIIIYARWTQWDGREKSAASALDSRPQSQFRNPLHRRRGDEKGHFDPGW